MLTDAECLRAERFRFKRHRRRFVVRRAMRRVLLAHLTAATPDKLLIEEPDRGKPTVRNGDTEFNASHTGDLGVIVTGNVPLGVDVESLDRSMDYLHFARHSFTKDEYRDISQCRDDDLPVAFFNCWTGKESYLKAIGLGLGKSLKSFAVQCSPEQRAGLRWDAENQAAARKWNMRRFTDGVHIVTVTEKLHSDSTEAEMNFLSPITLESGEPEVDPEGTVWQES